MQKRQVNNARYEPGERKLKQQDLEALVAKSQLTGLFENKVLYEGKDIQKYYLE